MFTHLSLGMQSFEISRKLKQLINNHVILLGGNRKLKIYGTLSCSSGKRMKKENRVFFDSEQEAIENGYRPCGHCMREQFKQWKLAQLK